MKPGTKKLFDAIAIIAIVCLVMLFARSVYRNNPDYVTLAVAISGIFFFVTSRFQKE